VSSYRATYEASISKPEEFWGEQSERIDWFSRPSTILDRSRPPFYRWFTDGRLNTCYNALDRHVVKGRADQTALIYDSSVTGSQRNFTYAQLL